MISMKYWVIYRYPKDYPHNYVVRRFTMNGDGSVLPSDEVSLAETLNEAREYVPFQSVCMPANKKDDPVIVETWI